MLFAVIKEPVKPGAWYEVETEDVKLCKARCLGVEREFDEYSNSYKEVFNYEFVKKNGFRFRVDEKTKNVKITEDKCDE